MVYSNSTVSKEKNLGLPFWKKGANAYLILFLTIRILAYLFWSEGDGRAVDSVKCVQNEAENTGERVQVSEQFLFLLAPLGGAEWTVGFE